MKSRRLLSAKNILLLVIAGFAVLLCSVVFGTNQTASAQDSANQSWNPLNIGWNKYLHSGDDWTDGIIPSVDFDDRFNLNLSRDCGNAGKLNFYNINKDLSAEFAIVDRYGNPELFTSRYVSLNYDENIFITDKPLSKLHMTDDVTFTVQANNGDNPIMDCYFEWPAPFILNENSEQAEMGSISKGSGPWETFQGSDCAYIAPHDEDAAFLGSYIDVDAAGNLLIHGITLNAETEVFDDTIYEVKVTPNDGYVFDYWDIDYYYKDAEEDIDINPEIDNAKVYPDEKYGLLFYGDITPHFKEYVPPEPPGPDPEPDPTPASETVQEVSTAQTGDNIPMGLISFVILLSIAGSCYVITRRAYGRK